MIIPIATLILVFVFIAVRQVGKFRLQMWQAMLLGAAIVLLTGQIHIMNALKAINIDVMLFLFGMFVIGEALERSGYLFHLSYKFFRRANSSDVVVLFILFGIGIASAFLMNDTLAIIGTPLMLILAKKYNVNAKLLLLTLAFAITIGSAMSPIGNPQNLLIAINGGITNPFVTFFKLLLVPTLINLFLTYILLKIIFKKYFHSRKLDHTSSPAINDVKLARLSKISLILIVAMIAFKIAAVFLNINLDIRLTYIALIGALPVIIFSSRRLEVVKKIDWYTLVFFAAMFILMESVWETGFFQGFINSSGANITSVPMILFAGVGLSQLISNVPMVALYLPLLTHLGVSAKELIALAAGSTIAGNLLILGAASNVIIIQNAEKRSRSTITFLEFAKIGIPLTIVNIFVYWVFLSLI